MGFHNLVNTRYFSEAAIGWRKNGGHYIKAPKGSRDYKEYWDEQEKRCRLGYNVADTWISGRHYFYLNFTPIWKVSDQQIVLTMKQLENSRDKRGNVSNTIADRVFEFPRFWEIDYEWYNFKNIAWHGGEFMGITSPGAQHMSCAKTRGAGFSYKEASDGMYNYTFIPGSKSYYFAGLEQYLTSDGILNKVSDMMSFVNQNCPEWRQNRMKSSTLMHQVASYIDEQGEIRGNLSEIIGVSVNDADKVRGKRGKKIVFEEAGSFRNLKQALAICIGSITAGGYTVGQISLFGTGGEEGVDIQGLEEIFDDPKAYNMLEFKNVWEPGMEHTSCGYFVPCYRANDKAIDLEGAPIVQDAIDFELSIRELKKKAKDYKELDRRQAEFPFFPSEVFKRTNANPFRTQAIKAQINFVEKNSYIQSLIRYGKFRDDEEKGLVFEVMPKDKAKPLLVYPHTKSNDPTQPNTLEGCVTVFEQPFRLNGATPADMYEVIFDPYYKEESEDLTSLFAVYVIKLYNMYDSKGEGNIVANFVGRPEDLDDAYTALFDLCRYYNAKCQGEIAGGGQGVLDYAKKHKLLNWVEFEPEMFDNTENGSNKKNRSRLMNLATEKKRMGLTYLVDWHKEPVGIADNGNKIIRINRIYDVGFLYELAKFDGKRNADRISAMIVGIIMLKEKAYKTAKKREQKQKELGGFFNRELFQDQYDDNELITSY